MSESDWPDCSLLHFAPLWGSSPSLADARWDNPIFYLGIPPSVPRARAEALVAHLRRQGANLREDAEAQMMELWAQTSVASTRFSRGLSDLYSVEQVVLRKGQLLGDTGTVILGDRADCNER